MDLCVIQLPEMYRDVLGPFKKMARMTGFQIEQLWYCLGLHLHVYNCSRTHKAYWGA